MPAAEAWRARARTVEAGAWLLLARLLIARVRFERWRATLGPRCPDPPSATTERRDRNLAARRLARAVERAAAHLPGESRCLAQAVALQWMLRARGQPGLLSFGVRPEQRQGGLDTLHAWVSRGGEVLIGASEERYLPVLVVGLDEASPTKAFHGC